ncbi:MAG: DUF488 family protein [Promethearchaeota archaeon]
MLERHKLKKLFEFGKKLETLGVNGLNQESFLKKIKEIQDKNTRFNEKKELRISKIVTIVEIRNNPYVKRNFRPNDLKELLVENGHEYIRFKALGNPFHKKHLEEGDFLSAKYEYQNYILKDNKAMKEFENLYAMIDKHNKINCLICYCPTRNCHRFWLRELLMRKKRLDLNLNPLSSENQSIKKIEV